ncbi:addiction module protein [Nitratifractor sp.]|uniref:addiction module protein n=1 Tax=Nitratifractor sp. TaxID=2268144 RepID=UPI003441EE6D
MGRRVKVRIETEKLTTIEKIQIMEELWNDLSRDSEFEMPQWHEKILSAREKELEVEKEALLDWDEVRKELLNR